MIFINAYKLFMVYKNMCDSYLFLKSNSGEF